MTTVVDPRRDLVAGILQGRVDEDVHPNWAYWLTDRILAALDDLHVHDDRMQITFDDETEPDDA